MGGGGGGGGTVGRFPTLGRWGERGDECVSAWKGERGNSPVLVAVKGGRKRKRGRLSVLWRRERHPVVLPEQ